MLKQLLAAASLAAVALPFAASAQPWGGGDYNRAAWDYGHYRAFAGYPQFRDEKAHIRAEIREGVEEGWLDDDQAADLYRRIQWVQRREMREFAEHGWSLPDWDQQQIKASLDQIDRSVDLARDGGGDER